MSKSLSGISIREHAYAALAESRDCHARYEGVPCKTTWPKCWCATFADTVIAACEAWDRERGDEIARLTAELTAARDLQASAQGRMLGLARDLDAARRSASDAEDEVTTPTTLDAATIDLDAEQDRLWGEFEAFMADDTTSTAPPARAEKVKVTLILRPSEAASGDGISPATIAYLRDLLRTANDRAAQTEEFGTPSWADWQQAERFLADEVRVALAGLLDAAERGMGR